MYSFPVATKLSNLYLQYMKFPLSSLQGIMGEIDLMTESMNIIFTLLYVTLIHLNKINKMISFEK